MVTPSTATVVRAGFDLTMPCGDEAALDESGYTRQEIHEFARQLRIPVRDKTLDCLCESIHEASKKKDVFGREVLRNTRRNEAGSCYYGCSRAGGCSCLGGASHHQQLAFTDASLLYRSRPSSAAAGLGLWFGAKDSRNLAAAIVEPPSMRDINRYELGAMYMAMLHVGATDDLVIATDSMCAIKMVEDPSRAKPKYRVLLHAIGRLMQHRLERGGSTTELRKVKAHSGCLGNEQADRLAKQAARSSRAGASVVLPDEALACLVLHGEDFSVSRQLPGTLF
ncbi:hypothetical protein COO60DRAFT_1643801 [Scenedesmus sp. NREL 46B-D3]|nr:hypothetical protein COO60DRAFT_1643801 [Scenedesmus sp. NREL 46B-D3]